MPRGVCMPAFLVRCPPQACACRTDPGAASPADGDPCRTRTCVRCLRGSRPTAGRTGRELVRKVEVSNPHGRAVSSVFETGCPGHDGIPSRAEGQRIERWRGRPRPSLSKRAPSLSVEPSRCITSGGGGFRRQRPGSIRTSILRLRRPLPRPLAPRGQMRTELTPVQVPPPGADPGTSARTRAALFPLSYGGVASPTGLEPVASAFGGQRSCPTELRRDGTPAGLEPRNWRFVVSCDHPFHHQGLAPQTGFDPAASAVTRRRSPD